jgi:hypothetical protein
MLLQSMCASLHTPLIRIPYSRNKRIYLYNRADFPFSIETIYAFFLFFLFFFFFFSFFFFFFLFFFNTTLQASFSLLG